MVWSQDRQARLTPRGRAMALFPAYRSVLRPTLVRRPAITTPEH